MAVTSTVDGEQTALQLDPPLLHQEGPGCAAQKEGPIKYRGLCWDRRHSSWRVRIYFAASQRHIGRFKDAQVAARAYDRAAYCLYGEKAILNFTAGEAAADQGSVPPFIRRAKELAEAAAAAVSASSDEDSSTATTANARSHANISGNIKRADSSSSSSSSSGGGCHTASMGSWSAAGCLPGASRNVDAAGSLLQQPQLQQSATMQWQQQQQPVGGQHQQQQVYFMSGDLAAAQVQPLQSMTWQISAANQVSPRWNAVLEGGHMLVPASTAGGLMAAASTAHNSQLVGFVLPAQTAGLQQTPVELAGDSSMLLSIASASAPASGPGGLQHFNSAPVNLVAAAAVATAAGYESSHCGPLPPPTACFTTERALLHRALEQKLQRQEVLQGAPLGGGGFAAQQDICSSSAPAGLPYALSTALLCPVTLAGAQILPAQQQQQHQGPCGLVQLLQAPPKPALAEPALLPLQVTAGGQVAMPEAVALHGQPATADGSGLSGFTAGTQAVMNYSCSALQMMQLHHQSSSGGALTAAVHAPALIQQQQQQQFLPGALGLAGMLQGAALQF